MTLDVQFTRAGIYLPSLGLWLDARKRQRGTERVFVSHAHSDHIGAHDHLLCSAATSLFMRTRLPGKRVETVLNFGEKIELEQAGLSFQLTMLPAGHILGSGMAFIEYQSRPPFVSSPIRNCTI